MHKVKCNKTRYAGTFFYRLYFRRIDPVLQNIPVHSTASLHTWVLGPRPSTRGRGIIDASCSTWAAPGVPDLTSLEGKSWFLPVWNELKSSASCVVIELRKEAFIFEPTAELIDSKADVWTQRKHCILVMMMTTIIMLHLLNTCSVLGTGLRTLHAYLI